METGEVEHWSLEHPEFGLLEVFIGQPDALREIDPDFPKPDKKSGTKHGKKSDKESGTELGDDPGTASCKESGTELGEESDTASGEESDKKSDKKLAERLESLEWDSQLLVRRDGVTIARYRSLTNHKIDLGKSGATVKAGKYGGETTLSAPYLGWTTNFLDRWVIEIKVKDDEGVVNFDPPAGTRARKRWEEMEASPFKRWFYPLITGLGKGGWALAVLVLGPLATQLIAWLRSFLPDWDINIPWPDIHLPSIPFPEVNLPSIPWPEWNLPDWELPDWHLPDWMDPILYLVGFMLGYSKIWVPIVVGIVVGLMAVRNSKRSKERKAKWNGQQAEVAMPPDAPDMARDRPGEPDAPDEGEDPEGYCPGEEPDTHYASESTDEPEDDERAGS